MAELLSARAVRLAVCVCGLLLALLPAAGCGGGDPGITDDAAPGDACAAYGAHVDWAGLDWKFRRHPLAHAYLFKRLRASHPYEKYLKETAFRGSRPAVDLTGFRQLPPADKEARRREALARYDDALALHRTVRRGWELWTETLQFAVVKAAMADEMGIITPALGDLKTAAGLDPSNPLVQYDLSYFAGIVGDRALQRQGLEGALAALAALDDEDDGIPLWRQSANLARLRLRLLLDLAWLDREEGFYEAGRKAVRQAMARMAGDGLRTLDEAREAKLLDALLTVDLGDVHTARRLALDLPDWPVPLQKRMLYGSAKAAMSKDNLEHFDSSFPRDWVWIMTFLHQDDREQALGRMRERNYLTEYPPHINYRFWRDMGRVLEHFGERPGSRLSYGFSIIYHPYFPYFPLQGARGISRVLGQTGTGQPYYLGYEHFYVAGSLFSYAANRVVGMEMARTPAGIRRWGEAAREALDICIRRGDRRPASLALRGRVHYRLGDRSGALADLTAAYAGLQEEGDSWAEVAQLLAIIHYERGDYAASSAWADRYLGLRPVDGFGWRMKGLCQVQAGRATEAAASLDYALKIDPHSLAAWHNLALVSLQQGEFDRAGEVLRQAAARYPGSPELAELARLVRERPTGEIDVAPATISLRTAPADSIWFSQTSLSTGADITAGLTPEEVAALIPELRDAYADHPDAEHRLELARALQVAGRSADVQRILLPLWPDGLTHEEVIQLLLADRARGQAARAIVLADRLQTDPNPYPDGELWSLVGIICLENGAAEKSRRALDLARALDPANAALQAVGR